MSLNLPKDWVRKAEVFIRDAEKHLEEGNYWLSCFEAQQACELYLKALCLQVTGIHPFTYDLVELINYLADAGLNPPENLEVYADALTPYYTLARYPGKPLVKYRREVASRCIDYARRIISWVKSEASQKES